MTIHTANGNRTTQWNITADNDTWIVGPDASFHIANGNGVAENGHTNSTIKVFGDIEIKGAGYAGVKINGSASSVLVGAQSDIVGKQGAFGLWSEAAGAEMINRGHITTGSTGIYGNIWGDVTNEGMIKARYGIGFEGDGSQIHNSGLIDASERGIAVGASGTLIVNEKDGEISGDLIGIYLDGDGDAAISNKGILRSNDVAFEAAGTGEQSFLNTGKIFGDVRLGAGEDVFDTRNGSVKGTIFGGGDSDVYRIASSSLKIFEGLGGGVVDQVLSTASYTLSVNIEELHLKGGKNLNGTGSSTDNNIYGNKGANILKGMGGADWLDGGAGDDLLIGGGNSDTFAFEKGYGRDIVQGFQDGIDLFHSSLVNGQSAFDNLDIKQVGENTVINFGDGDRLVIADTLKTNIGYGDFV